MRNTRTNEGRDETNKERLSKTKKTDIKTKGIRKYRHKKKKEHKREMERNT